jgi:plasmid stability protein
MTTLTVRGLDDDTRARLRVRAARNGRSMEAEVRAILRDAVAEPDGHTGLGSRIAARFAAVGGVDLEPPPRGEMPRPAPLDA